LDKGRGRRRRSKGGKEEGKSQRGGSAETFSFALLVEDVFEFTLARLALEGELIQLVLVERRQFVNEGVSGILGREGIRNVLILEQRRDDLL